jgi:hypothetical protein
MNIKNNSLTVRKMECLSDTSDSMVRIVAKGFIGDGKEVNFGSIVVSIDISRKQASITNIGDELFVSVTDMFPIESMFAMKT